MKKLLTALALFAQTLAALPARAAENLPHDWQLNFQTPASPVMEKLYEAHNYLLILIIAISLLVLFIMTFICIRFRRKANPVPSKTTHNTLLEIIWTAIPVIILVAIAIPSIRLHYYMQRVVEPEMTLKVVGYQWYWHYEYPDQGGFGFDSYMKKDKELKPGDIRLLAVDNRVVVPVDTTIRVLVTGADVIHAFAVPAFGVKKDALPGRLNETWFKAERIGTFFGQCSELCGVGHGFMPIVIDVVSKEDFATWVAKKQKEAGIKPAEQAAEDGKPATTPAGDKNATPLATPEKPAATHEKQADAQKERSKETGEGKPSKPAPAPKKEEKEDSSTEESKENE